MRMKFPPVAGRSAIAQSIYPSFAVHACAASNNHNKSVLEESGNGNGARKDSVRNSQPSKGVSSDLMQNRLAREH